MAEEPPDFRLSHTAAPLWDKPFFFFVPLRFSISSDRKIAESCPPHPDGKASWNLPGRPPAFLARLKELGGTPTSLDRDPRVSLAFEPRYGDDLGPWAGG